MQNNRCILAQKNKKKRFMRQLKLIILGNGDTLAEKSALDTVLSLTMLFSKRVEPWYWEKSFYWQLRFIEGDSARILYYLQ